MSGRCLGVLVVLFVLVLIVFACSVYLQTSAVDGFHYSVDTMTLRGRIANPEDKELAIPWLFKLAEDVVAIVVFVILGFGLSFYSKSIELRVAKAQFKVERKPEGPRIPAAPAAKRPQLVTWQEWLRDRDPALYAEYYGETGERKERTQKFKRWLFDVDRP